MQLLPELGLAQPKTDVVALDLRDKKILYLFSQNVRAPLSAIAKNVKLSRDSVKYRLTKLEERGVLKNSRVSVNVGMLGYGSYHLFLRLNNPTKQAEEKFIKQIIALPYVRALLRFYGKYDYEIAIVAQSPVDFDRILTEIVGVTETNLEERELLIVTGNFRAGAFPGNFLRDIPMPSHEKKKPTEQPCSLDKKDYEIMKFIRDNAQLSLLDISGRVKLSPDAVSYRLRKMEQGFILGYVPVINYRALGYSVNAILLDITNLDPEKEKKLERFLKTDENILWGVKTLGKFNVLIYTCTYDDAELQKTVSALRALFPEKIKNYDSLLATDEFKYTYVPDCLFSG